MKNKLETIFNSKVNYFFILLLLWTVVGFVLLLTENNKSIYIYINNLHTPFLDQFFALITYLGTFPLIAIVLLCLFILPKYRTWKFTLFIIICNVFPFLIIQVLKNLFSHPRPLRFFENADWINKVAGQPELYSLSFPSGHSEGAFALCCFLSLILSKRYSLLGIPLFLIALLVAFSRVYLSQHFYDDIYVGSLAGSFGVLIAYVAFHRLANNSVSSLGT